MSKAVAGRERLVERYAALVAAGDIEHDPAQYALCKRLDALNDRLAESRPASKRSPLGRLLSRRRTDSPLRGLYIFGEVGRGKTMLMDLFFAGAVPKRKRRAHFHEFMAEVHDRIHAARAKAAGRSGDPILTVAAALADEIRLLCLDEFMVTDIADAMILSRLFGALFERGVILVATSNSAPEALYRDGLNRALFLPFIALLRRQTEVVGLVARTDYRLEKLGRAPVYVTPLGPPADAALDAAWRRLTGTARGAPAALPAMGRLIPVPEADKGVARFAFADLCEAPLGAADFLKIARAFRTILIDRIPVIEEGRRDVARRFIALIDELYDNGVKLVASAAAEPDLLYTATDGEEALAFRRTASRLTEMRSEAYLAAPEGTERAAESREAI